MIDLKSEIAKLHDWKRGFDAEALGFPHHPTWDYQRGNSSGTANGIRLALDALEPGINALLAELEQLRREALKK